ncbi:MAG: hypothetical protein EXS18_03225 [Verrucomicrobiae bacterium]|nr:hypothetical protein [Verrucomicrobiae bacterium]
METVYIETTIPSSTARCWATWPAAHGKILKLLLAKGKITPAIVENLLSWKHSGFSVDKSVRIEAGKTEALEGLKLALRDVRLP